MRLKQLNLQESMQLKRHCLGISKIQTKKKILSVSQHGFESGSKGFTVPNEDISPKQRCSFIENATKAFTRKSRLPKFGNALQCESSRLKRPAKFVKSEMT